jgi:error-prone DNA polymerase
MNCIPPLASIRQAVPAAPLADVALAVRDELARIDLRSPGWTVRRPSGTTNCEGLSLLTLEDEHGMINMIVSPGLVMRDGQHLHSGSVLLVEGAAQRETEVINVIAQRVGPLGIG